MKQILSSDVTFAKLPRATVYRRRECQLNSRCERAGRHQGNARDVAARRDAMPRIFRLYRFLISCVPFYRSADYFGKTHRPSCFENEKSFQTILDVAGKFLG